MSCGCGCCPKCGCQATCTCNRNMWSSESLGDFSYTRMKSAADELNGQFYFADTDTKYPCLSNFAVTPGNGKTCAKDGSTRWLGVGEELQGGSQYWLSWEFMRQ